LLSSNYLQVNHLLITPNKSSQLNKVGVHIPVVLDSTRGQIFLNSSMAEVGAVGESTLSMLSALLTEPDLHLQLSCTTAPDLSTQCNTSGNTSDRNVKYRNPHRISGRDPVAPMTFELRSLAFSHKETVSPCDILAGFESDEVLPESESPPALKTVLYPYVYSLCLHVNRT
jgi:hypothetical protein